MSKHEKPEIIDPTPIAAQACPYTKCMGKQSKLGLLVSGLDWWVYCKNCHASGPVGHNEYEAVTFWNDRIVVPPRPYSHIPKLLLLFALLSALAGCAWRLM